MESYCFNSYIIYWNFYILLNCFEDKFEYNDSNYNEELPKVTSDNTNKNQEQNQVIIYNRKDNDQAEERKEELKNYMMKI